MAARVMFFFGGEGPIVVWLCFFPSSHGQSVNLKAATT